MGQDDDKLVERFRERAKYMSNGQLVRDGWFKLSTVKRLRDVARKRVRITPPVRGQIQAFLSGTDEQGVKLVQNVPRATTKQNGGPTVAQKAAGYDAIVSVVKVISGDVTVTGEEEHRRMLAEAAEAFARVLRDLGSPRHPDRGAGL